MKVKRELTIDTNFFTSGDIISFTLSDGEEVEAIAVKEGNTTLFVLRDCLNREYHMNPTDTNEGGYEASELRRKLNGEILGLFPEEIRSRMVPFENGDFLRLPTEKEIFGCNEYGCDEGDVEQWECMKRRRNRIAFDLSEGTEKFQWYWLQNPTENSSTRFARVAGDGNCNSSGASYASGVRPAFALK